MRILVTCSLLLAAIICYGIGFTPGFGLFLALGACFETVFWVRLFKHRYKRNERLESLKSAN